MIKDILVEFDSFNIIIADPICDGFKKKYKLIKNDIDAIFQSVSSKICENDGFEEIPLGEAVCFFNIQFHKKQFSLLRKALEKDMQHSETKVCKYIEKFISLPQELCKEYSNLLSTCGEYYDFDPNFEGQHYFVAHANAPKLKICVSCGHAEIVDEEIQELWYCSEYCKETEKMCVKIKEVPPEKFVEDAAIHGFVLMSGADAWVENHKVFATGGQGHGFAAEKGNTLVDKTLGKDAQIIGDDNAKHGADRLVDGQEIQTKYCRTATRSVNAGFDGASGDYKYIDAQGNPMQIEVPKDQYPKAVAEMAEKIKEGKVPGVTDPMDASKLVREGSLTYNQSVNITKFGTFESIAFDAREGVVIAAAAAGGISFGITATIHYAKTKDTKKALRASSVQAGKTFGKSLTVYVSAQQLHRVAAIQSVLKRVDVSKFSSASKSFLEKGLGTTSVEATNKALRGTLVTSVVIVAVSTGPQIVKLVQGRISRAQFIKNLGVVSSGVSGGVVGSIVGGTAGAALGPVGVFAGQLAGGVIGGMLASAVANTVAKSFMKDDREIVMDIIQRQLEFLSVTFMLNEDEIKNLNTNLENIINKKTMEIIFAAKTSRRAMANLILKPIIISVVKQRSVLIYQANDVIDACAEWVEMEAA